jgi:hypothetical protein
VDILDLPRLSLLVERGTFDRNVADHGVGR